MVYAPLIARGNHITNYNTIHMGYEELIEMLSKNQ